MLYNFLKIFAAFAIAVFILSHPALSAQQNSISKLNALEMQLFNQSFQNEPVKNRLDRIEKVIYGKTYAENESKRLERVTAFAVTPKQPQKQQNVNPQSPPETNGSAASPESSVPKDDSGTDYPVITTLENSAFHKNFKGENVYLRLNRLESSVFGTTFPQDSLYNRVDKLKSALNTANPEDYGSRTAQNANGATFFANLSSLELIVFSQSYDAEAIPNRLSRLESKVFGATQQGTPENRLARLNQNIENNFSAYYPNNNTNLGGMNQNYSTTTTSTSGGAKAAVWDVIKSILFNFLTSGYGNYGSGNYYSPNGYYGYNDPYSSYSRSINTNTGVGVHILP